MEQELILQQSITIKQDQGKVWEALTQSEWTKQYMYGSSVHSSWEKGSEIRWVGEFQGISHELKGKILDIAPGTMLCYSNFDPAGELEDIESNYLIIRYELHSDGQETTLSVNTSNFGGNQKRYEETKAGWTMVLENIKKLLEA